MSEQEQAVERRQVGNLKRGLTVEIRRGKDIKVAIERTDGGLVQLAADEVRALAIELKHVADDLLEERLAGLSPEEAEKERQRDMINRLKGY